MYKFIKKNQKKMMAVLGVGLMIVFILPTTFTQMGGQNPVVAKMDGAELRYRDFAQAERDWQLLMMVPTIVWNMGQPQIAPLPYLLGVEAVQGISQHPELYVILQQEAAKMGVYGSEEELNQILSSPVIGSGEVDVNSPAVRGAVARFLPVLDAYQRIAGTIKISGPMVRHEMAAEQALTVKLVSFDAAASTQPSTQPSSEAIEQQFQRFANVVPGRPDARNPFGFGYRYPHQVKLQYVSVPFAQVREVVESSKSPYDWEVEEYRYYMQHESEFATTEPATQSTTQPSTQPWVQPFEQVQQRIHEQLLHQQAQELATAVQGRISSALNADYVGFARSPDPSTRPSTNLGAPYDSFEYLQQLRDVVESETRVRVTIHQVAAFMGEEQLAKLPNIGTATYRGLEFPHYAVDGAAAFALPDVPETETLQVYQPSGILSDNLQNTYIFRLTDTRAAHAPQTADEVKEQIIADLQRQAAFERAKASAEQLREAATQAGSNLTAAAKSAGQSVLRVGPIYRQAPLTDYPLSGVARQNFDRQLQTLLEDAARTGHAHPVALVELPTAGKVAVVELEGVQAPWDKQTQALMQLQIDRLLRQQMNSGLQRGWFDYDAVLKRTNYQRLERADQPAPQPPPPPMF